MFTRMRSPYLKRVVLAIGWLGVFTSASAAAPSAAADTFTFKSAGGQTTNAIHGSLQVPENRSDPHSRMLTLCHVRFPATTNTPGAPIIYLSGGPGGSGIQAAGKRRFPLFMAMRQFGDVIALDRRGTGESDDTPVCERSKAPLDSDVMTDASYRAAALERASLWTSATRSR